LNKFTKNEAGSALLVALVVMGLLSMLAISLATRTETEIDLNFNQLNEEKAFYLAEAGANRAIVQLNQDNDWRTGYDGVRMNDGSYTVVLVDSAADATLDDTVLVQSTGEKDGAVSKVELTTIPEYKYPFTLGLFADAGITLARNTCTDSYNSDSGAYAVTAVDSAGDIGSNGTVTSSKDVSFGGNISVATAGGITLGANNTVTGDTTSTADSVSLDFFTDDDFAYAKTNNDAKHGGLSGVNYTYNPGSGDLVGGSFSTITLQSGVYYFNSIDLGQGSNLVIAPGASVQIYVEGDIHLGQQSTMNAGGSPLDMLVYSKGANLKFDQDNVFVGAFYGPNAYIKYDQTTQAFGALVGNSIQLDQGACFHFDRNLAKAVHKKTGRMFQIAWGEKL